MLVQEINSRYTCLTLILYFPYAILGFISSVTGQWGILEISDVITKLLIIIDTIFYEINYRLC